MTRAVSVPLDSETRSRFLHLSHFLRPTAAHFAEKCSRRRVRQSSSQFPHRRGDRGKCVAGAIQDQKKMIRQVLNIACGRQASPAVENISQHVAQQRAMIASKHDPSLRPTDDGRANRGVASTSRRRCRSARQWLPFRKQLISNRILDPNECLFCLDCACFCITCMVLGSG